MEAIDHRWGQSPEKIFGVVGCDMISQLVFMVVLLYIDHKKTFIVFFFIICPISCECPIALIVKQ